MRSLPENGIEYIIEGVTIGVLPTQAIASYKKGGGQGIIQGVTLKECKQAERFFQQRLCARQARAYICAYYSLYESKCMGEDMLPTLTLPLLERPRQGIQNPTVP
jgi:hypothetical protein